MKLSLRHSAPLWTLLGLLVFFEVAALYGWINEVLIPPPHLVLTALKDNAGDFARAFVETTFAAGVGFVSAALLGFFSAVLFSRLPWLKRAVLPFAIFFQTVPIIAIAPLLVIYFGFGITTVIASATVVSVFPVLASTLLGLESLDPGYLELFRVYRATPGQILWQARLPLAYPSIYGGLKVAAGLSVIGTVAGEFVAGGGLGAMIDSARTQQRIDLVFAALALLSLLGWGMITVLKLSHRLIRSWRPFGLHLSDE